MRLQMLVGGALLASLAAVAVPLPALPHAETTTTHFSGTVSEPDTNPCTGAPGTITETFPGVTHVTGLPNGTGHQTTTLTGTFTFVPEDPSQPALTGKFTIRNGGNFNKQNTVATAISVFLARGTDGSRADAHLVFHITVNPDSTVTVTFEKPRLNCR